MLEEMDADTVRAIRLPQLSRMLLAQQGQLVEELMAEGIMTYQNAEEVCRLSVCGHVWANRVCSCMTRSRGT